MVNMIKNDIFEIIRKYGPYGAISGIIILVIIYCLFTLKSKLPIKTLLHKYIKEIIIAYVIYIYCFAVIAITFVSREPGSRDGLDLLLFSTFSHKLEDNIYPVENVILFIPFGFLMPILSKRFQNMLHCLILGSIFSIIIEISQYFAKRGYCQIDDIMTNTIGALVGYIIYCGIIKLVDMYKIHSK